MSGESESDLFSDDSCADKTYDINSDAGNLRKWKERLSSSEEETVRELTDSTKRRRKGISAAVPGKCINGIVAECLPYFHTFIFFHHL